MYKLLLILVLSLTLRSVEAQETGSAVGELVNGKRQGLWFQYNSFCKLVWELNYEQGVPHGWFSKFSPYSNQIIVEGEYYYGARVGNWDYYNPQTAMVDSTVVYYRAVLFTQIKK